MATPRSVAPALLARAHADQVTTLYAGWHRTTLSMLLGAALLCLAMWGVVAPALMLAFVALVIANQAWRGLLVRAWRRAHPGTAAAPRWGRYWAAGSASAGALWGAAALIMYPEAPAHQALLIVCLFGVVLGGLNLTAIYKPSFYGFVLPALLPLIVRIAWDGDRVHLNIAIVLFVVLAFVLAFGHRVNDVLTQSLATRYENVDLIGELKSQTRAALDARGAAEAANRAKTQLLAAASHDLRQPLHALGLFVAALAAKVREVELKPLVGRVQGSLEALDAQFAQLLDLSRLEAGMLVPERARVPLGPLFAHVAAEHAPQASAKGLRCIGVPTGLAVDSDPIMLQRILRNLVGNALRYTRTGGVVIGARRRGDRVAIEVADTGIGIASEHAARVFEEFYQVPGSAAAGTGGHGMGLGLAIVRRLAVLLGHEVTLDSRPGRGSRFCVLAPRVTDVRPRAQGLPAAMNPVRPGSAASSSALAGAVVLVVDDDLAAIEGMHALFATWDAVVAGGTDAAAALAALGRLERYPDLIVADLRLAEHGSGLDAIARIRDELGVAIPAIVVSGDTGADASGAVRGAGLSLLPKPVVPAALEAAAAALVAQNRSILRSESTQANANPIPHRCYAPTP
jgi:signal transduction histidine kinase/CheY-like chemotaxis protein